ncbi:serine/threonine-protein kinase HAL4/sat4 [Modicella reniformis]|uniref:non-specific serine/threonine protein kinase n=1 Tax=Modicella reniformis TaxID=1440133 RepID=A0A9P6MHZ8_9FUNG|nr:serine/threonine-protein kinase HAL4/sat4 [Modicella reniformis]
MHSLSLEQSHAPPDATPTPTLLTREALAAQDSSTVLQNDSTSPSSLPPPIDVVATAPGSVPELHMQEPSPALATRPNEELPLPSSKRPPIASSPKPRGSPNRFPMLAEIPSVYDLHASGSPSPNKSRSASPSDTGSSSARSFTNESKHRFEKLPNGGHRHHLSAPKRHQFLAKQVRRLRGFLDGMKEKDNEKEGHDHGHGHHDIVHGQGHGNGDGDGHGNHINRELLEHPLSLLMERIDDFEADHHNPNNNVKKKHGVKEDFVQKYGDLQHVVGRGAFGTVRLSIKKDSKTGEEVVFAIKEFKHQHDESQKSYMRRLTSEFCIASTLEHINIIQTLDLLQLHGDAYSEVMEYCPGGDLHTLIASASTLGETEAGCFFAQLISGVAFLHSMGVVHRDLKPENLLLTADGCIKIADFGNSEVFRMPWENKVRASTSIRGSGPFIAPEEFTSKTFDARKVDTWSCGIIYMCMRLGRYNWAEASKDHPTWDTFLRKVEQWHEASSKGRAPGSTDHHSANNHVPKFINLAAIEATTHTTLGWPNHISEVINSLLEPNPKSRWQVGNVLESEWMQMVDNCHPAESPAKQDQDLDESAIDPSPSQRVGSKVLEQDSKMTGYGVVKEAKNRRVQDNEAMASASSSPPLSAAADDR